MFEKVQDINKEKNAIALYISLVGGNYKKLSPSDVDFRLLNDAGSLTGYAEVKVLSTSMREAFPLTVEARKIIKLRDKRLRAIMIWYCLDGILYSSIENLKGESFWDETSGELMLSYKDKKTFKYVRA